MTNNGRRRVIGGVIHRRVTWLPSFAQHMSKLEWRNLRERKHDFGTVLNRMVEEQSAAPNEWRISRQTEFRRCTPAQKSANHPLSPALPTTRAVAARRALRLAGRSW